MTTFNDKLKLFKGLCKGDIAYNAPFYVTVDLTRRCNLRCLGCRYHSHEAENFFPGDVGVSDIPYPLFESLLEQLKEVDTREVILIGEGEPMLHPRFPDMIDSLKGCGMKVSLFTNGTLLDEAACLNIIEASVDRVIVSIWGTTPGEYEKNNPGTPIEYFDRVVRGLKALSAMKAKLKSIRPKLQLHMPINRYNYKRLDSMVDMAQDTGCDIISLSPLRPRHGEVGSSALSAVEEKALKASLPDIRKRLDSISMGHNIASTLLSYDIGEEVWKKLPCYTGWYHCRVKVDGSVYPCNACDISVGNLNDKSFSDIWNGTGLRAFRKRARTLQGLTELSHNICDCGFCCHTWDNMRIHRLFRWVAPLTARST